jgi:hypothetical protein
LLAVAVEVGMMVAVAVLVDLEQHLVLHPQ